MCAHKDDKKRIRAGIVEVKTVHEDLDRSLFLVEQDVPVIDLTSDSTYPGPRKKQVVADVDCNCPMCDFDECLKFARKVFPGGLIPVKDGKITANIPEVTCRRNKHIDPMFSDECLVRDLLKNTIGRDGGPDGMKDAEFM